ncbi:hypothetical protein FI667_g6845, partial [Globisporangium splendens]
MPHATVDTSSTEELLQPHAAASAGSAFFSAREYRSKDDVIAAVVAYNHLHRRAYKVLTSDRRRYKVACVYPSCSFLVRFAFSTTFKPPTKFQPHDCVPVAGGSGTAIGSSTMASQDGATRDSASTATPDENVEVTQAPDITAAVAELDLHLKTITNRACRPKQIVRYPEVRALILEHGDKVKTAWINDVLVKSGLRPTYANCFHARKRLLQELTDDPEKFRVQQDSSLLSLATFATTSPAPASISRDGDDDEGETKSCSSANQEAPAFGTTASTKKKRKLDDSSLAVGVVTVEAKKSEGCCFICPSVPVNAKEINHILQWELRDATAVKSFFDLYDNNRRIEILKAGKYMLHVYLEALVDDNSVDPTPSSNDLNPHKGDGTAKYYLLVNNKPLNVFTNESEGARNGSLDSGDHQTTGDDIPVGVFNVAEVDLKKWDMIVLRRTQAMSCPDDPTDAVRTPFVRFIIEPVRVSALV